MLNNVLPAKKKEKKKIILCDWATAPTVIFHAGELRIAFLQKSKNVILWPDNDKSSSFYSAVDFNIREYSSVGEEKLRQTMKFTWA